MSFLNITPKKLIVGAAIPMAVLASGGMVWQSSYSAFSATTASPTNNWSAGTVALVRRRQQHRDVHRDQPQARRDRHQVHRGHLDRVAGLHRQALRHRLRHHQRPGRATSTSRSRRAPAPPPPAAPASPAASTLYDGAMSTFGTTKTSFATGVGQLGPDRRHARPRPTGSPTRSARAPRTPPRAAPQPSASPGSPRTADRTSPPHTHEKDFISQMNIYVPAQRPAPDQAAAAAAPAPEAEALGWGRVLRLTVARASLAMVVSLVIWSLLPLLAGWTPRVIMSGSMEPRIHVGDIVVTRTVPGASVTKGQVVTVKDPDHPAKTRTHRVLRRAADGTIVTKGDANPQADSRHISNDDVLGVGVVRVPWVGRPAYWMAEQNWLALGATSLFLGLVPGHRPSRIPQARGHRRRRPAPVLRARPAATRVRAAPPPPSPSPRWSWALPRVRPRRRSASVANPTSTLVGCRARSTPTTPRCSPTRRTSTGASDETSGTAIDDATGTSRDGTLLAQTYASGQTGALTSEPPTRR